MGTANKMAELDAPKIDPVMEKPWQRVKRMQRYELYNKSQYPPMDIEPFRDERARLAGGEMTPEQRALRKQWVKDQILHHPKRDVPELRPLNIFRRIYRFPADLLIYKPLVMAGMSQGTAGNIRYVIPKLVMTFFGAGAVIYFFRYNTNDWTRSGGWSLSWAKPDQFGLASDKAFVDKADDDFFDHGFKKRKALLYKE